MCLRFLPVVVPSVPLPYACGYMCPFVLLHYTQFLLLQFSACAVPPCICHYTPPAGLVVWFPSYYNLSLASSSFPFLAYPAPTLFPSTTTVYALYWFYVLGPFTPPLLPPFLFLPLPWTLPLPHALPSCSSVPASPSTFPLPAFTYLVVLPASGLCLPLHCAPTLPCSCPTPFPYSPPLPAHIYHPAFPTLHTPTLNTSPDLMGVLLAGLGLLLPTHYHLCLPVQPSCLLCGITSCAVPYVLPSYFALWEDVLLVSSLLTCHAYPHTTWWMAFLTPLLYTDIHTQCALLGLFPHSFCCPFTLTGYALHVACLGCLYVDLWVYATAYQFVVPLCLTLPHRDCLWHACLPRDLPSFPAVLKPHTPYFPQPSPVPVPAALPRLPLPTYLQCSSCFHCLVIPTLPVTLTFSHHYLPFPFCHCGSLPLVCLPVCSTCHLLPHPLPCPFFPCPICTITWCIYFNCGLPPDCGCAPTLLCAFGRSGRWWMDLTLPPMPHPLRSITPCLPVPSLYPPYTCCDDQPHLGRRDCTFSHCLPTPTLGEGLVCLFAHLPYIPCHYP